MERRTVAIAWILSAASAVACVRPSLGPPPSQDSAAIRVVSGRLVHYRLSDELFHIDDLWLRVAPGTEFHRWLSAARNKRVTILLATGTDRFAEASSGRILIGELVHGTAPQDGAGLVHVLVLRDHTSNTLGPITFQTDDLGIARKFDVHAGEMVSILVSVQ